MKLVYICHLNKKFIKVKVGHILKQIYISLTLKVLLFNPYCVQNVKNQGHVCLGSNIISYIKVWQIRANKHLLGGESQSAIHSII